MNKPKPLQFPRLNLPKWDFRPIKIDTSAFESLAQIGRSITVLHQNFAAITQPLFKSLGEAFKDARKADAALEAGWVPFAGMPVDKFDDTTPPDEIRQLLDKYTVEEWPDIRKQLSDSATASGVDAEALATFEEALIAHEAGLYRSVVRVLFPEIERVAREYVYDGDRREAPEGKRPKGKLNTGLKDFREAVWSKLPAGIVANSRYGITLANKMYEHLYKWVGETDENLGEFRNDPVPNRHASQHGYVAYSSRQNSMNMLAMSDFMFHLIMSANDYLVKAATKKRAKVQEIEDDE